MAPAGRPGADMRCTPCSASHRATAHCCCLVFRSGRVTGMTSEHDRRARLAVLASQAAARAAAAHTRSRARGRAEPRVPGCPARFALRPRQHRHRQCGVPPRTLPGSRPGLIPVVNVPAGEPDCHHDASAACGGPRPWQEPSVVRHDVDALRGHRRQQRERPAAGSCSVRSWGILRVVLTVWLACGLPSPAELLPWPAARPRRWSPVSA